MSKGKLDKQKMIDIETLGTKAGCVVLSIGVTSFDEKMLRIPVQAMSDVASEIDLQSLDQEGIQLLLKELRANTAYYTLPILPQLAAGLVIDPSTAKWWSGKAAFPEVDMVGDVRSKLLVLSDTLVDKDQVCRYWAKSPRFDFNILEALFRAFDVPWTIPFRQEDDVRSYEHDWPELAVFDLKPLNLVPHNAGDDACGQAIAVMRVQQFLRIKGAL